MPEITYTGPVKVEEAGGGTHILTAAEITGPAGPTGATGPTGPQGPPGAGGGLGSDANYVYTQIVPATTWSVTHTLNKYPAIEVIDSGGTEITGDVNYVSTTEVTLTFKSPFGGKAILN